MKSFSLFFLLNTWVEKKSSAEGGAVQSNNITIDFSFNRASSKSKSDIA